MREAKIDDDVVREELTGFRADVKFKAEVVFGKIAEPLYGIRDPLADPTMSAENA